MKNKLIISKIHDPYFNLASEEYILKNTDDNYIYLWINNPAVIVGVNQNTFQEVNLNYAKNNNIKIVRRLTGGGAVYHDLNNLCYTYISKYNKDVNNYIEFTKPIISYLNSIGVNAKFSGRNDICIDNKKISGNAQTIYKDRIMHHGTLLFKTDYDVLNNVLTPSSIKIESKGIKSNRSRVTNISDYLPNDFTIDNFICGLSNYISNDYISYDFNEDEINKINKLKDQKYSTSKWNMGESPRGSVSLEYKFSFGLIKLNFDIENGKILNMKIYGDYFEIKPIIYFENQFNEIDCSRDCINKVLLNGGDYIYNFDITEVINKIYQ